jgi:hypothetical protein
MYVLIRQTQPNIKYLLNKNKHLFIGTARQSVQQVYLYYKINIKVHQTQFGQVDSDRLEKLQLEAARIVTGLTCYTSLDSIYRETGWEKLSTR